MTYCCGLLLKDGLVMIADTRTNAGVDNISVFPQAARDRGDPTVAWRWRRRATCPVTQSVMSDLAAGVRDPVTDEVHTLITVRDMFSAAKLLGDTTAQVRRKIADAVGQGVPSGVTLLFGGQIAGEPMRFFLIYGEGNFIECEPRNALFPGRRGQVRQADPAALRQLRDRPV